MSLIKQIKLEDNLYDIGAKWSNIDKENIVYGPSEIINFEDNKIEPLKKCIINIKAVQEGSGEPSPANIRPISGWTRARVTSAGKNLLPLIIDSIKAVSTAGTWSGNVYSIGGLTFTFLADEDGHVTGIDVNGTSTETTEMTLIGTRDKLALRPGNFILTGCTGGQGGTNYTYYLWATGYGATIAQAISAATVVITEEQKNVQIGISVNSGVTMDHVMFYPMLRPEADTVATFEPYRGTIHDFAWESEAGIVYGGTLNVLTGTLTVDRVCKTLIGTDIQARGSNVTSAGDYRFYSTADASQDILLPLNAQTAADVLCSVAVAIPHGNSNLYGVSVNRLDSRIYLHIQECGQMTLEEFRTWVDNHNVQIAYKIITPIIYQLSPQIIFTLLGNNNIWADCGDISIELENFYSDIQSKITTNLNENMLLYNKNYSLTTSNHYITNDKISINSLDHYDNYNLYINGSTLTNHHITLQKSDNVVWSSNGSDDEPSFIMEGADNKFFKFRFSRYGRNIDIGWDWEAMDGAGIAVRGATADASPGQFILFARKPNVTINTTADTTQLSGSPDGLLKWAKSSGDSNPRLAINATTSNYNLYVNGTSYFNGEIDIGNNSSSNAKLIYNTTNGCLEIIV